MVVTIDGATGVGKSTIAKRLSKVLGYSYVSTGRVYRSLAYTIINSQVYDDIGFYIDNLAITFSEQNEMIANGIERDDILQNEKVAYLAAEIGANIEYKKAISEKIVHAVDSRGVVVEGRKSGTILFPTAELKVYLFADINTRVVRKMQGKNDSTFGSVMEALQKRDELVCSLEADYSLSIDVSHRTVESVVSDILNYVPPCI